MTLRVFLIDNDGNTSVHTYGLEAKNHKGILKTEILEDTMKVRAWSGSKFVGLAEFDDPPKPRVKKSKSKTSKYEIFDWHNHDTDNKYYWVSALCSNCNESSQIAIPQGQKVDRNAIKKIPCGKCHCEKTLAYAKYDGHKYVRVGK